MTRALRAQTLARRPVYVRTQATADDLADLASDPRMPAYIVREALRAAAVYATLDAAANAARLGVRS